MVDELKPELTRQVAAAYRTETHRGDLEAVVARGSHILWGRRIANAVMVVAIICAASVGGTLLLRDDGRATPGGRGGPVGGAVPKRSKPVAGRAGGVVTAFPAPTFQQGQGWSSATTGTVSSDSGAEPGAWTSNTSLVPPGPYFKARFDSLPDDGIFIYAGMLFPERYPNPPSATFPDRQLPLQVTDAEIQNQWEGQPVTHVPQYVLPARVDSQYVVVYLYFGNQNPSQSELNAAQQQLDTLAIPNREP